MDAVFNDDNSGGARLNRIGALWSPFGRGDAEVVQFYKIRVYPYMPTGLVCFILLSVQTKVLSRLQNWHVTKTASKGQGRNAFSV